MLALTAACATAVLIAVCVRIAGSDPARAALRTPAVALSLATTIGLAAFTLLGPLAHGWARRAGTPANLLPKAPLSVARVVPGSSRVTAVGGSTKPFTALLAGSVTQSQAPGGAVVDLDLRLRGGARGRLRVRLGGTPIPGGGLSMTGSQVDLIANGLPSVMAGQISSLQGQEFIARVLGSSGAALTLHARLHIDSQSGAVTGLLSASPSTGGR